MKVGKIPLNRVVDILKHAGVAPSLDANPVEGDLVVSTNPAVGVPSEALGFFAFHYSAANVAVAHAQPLYATLTVTMPPGASDEEVEAVVRGFAEECRRYGVRLVGGHTARYEGIEYPLAASTVIGRKVRDRAAPSTGDTVYAVGLVGAEAAWLLGGSVPLREMTPLDHALQLQEASEVKFMHDVSEGGVLGALVEVSLYYSLEIELQPEGVKLHPGIPEWVDPFTAPSYGVLLAFTDSPREFEALCDEKSLPCSKIGSVKGPGAGVWYKSTRYLEPPASPLVELYNPHTPGSLELAQLELAARSLMALPGFEQLIPEVGANIAFAKPRPEKPEDVAAIDGRLIKTRRGVRVCGKPTFGASRHLARVLIEASRINPNMRAAISVKPDPAFLEALRGIGINPVDVSSFASECPVSKAIESGTWGSAFYYHDIPNLEPSLVILAESPLILVDIIRRALERGRFYQAPHGP